MRNRNIARVSRLSHFLNKITYKIQGGGVYLDYGLEWYIPQCHIRLAGLMVTEEWPWDSIYPWKCKNILGRRSG